MSDVIDISLTADATALARIEGALEAFAEQHGLAPKAAYGLSLVVEELVTNIVKYGYGDGAPGPVWLAVRLEDGSIVGTLTDAGIAFDPTGMDTPDVDAEMDERHVGGLGVHLVRTLAEEFAYHRDGDRNVVTFRLAA